MNFSRSRGHDPPALHAAPGRGIGAGLAGHHRSPNALAANSTDLKKKHKAAIMLWMGGGPATIDIWDLKPGAPTGGPFKPISTSGDLQISEHMPLMAKQMKHMAIIRSMSTREADHARGRYYMHTGYVPNPNIEHPGLRLGDQPRAVHSRMSGLEIPPFVAVGGGSVGPGFLGMTIRPVRRRFGRQRPQSAHGRRRQTACMQRMEMLGTIENGFVSQVSPEGSEPRSARPAARPTIMPRCSTRPWP